MVPKAGKEGNGGVMDSNSETIAELTRSMAHPTRVELLALPC